MINQQDDQKINLQVFEPQKQNHTANNMSEPLKIKNIKTKSKIKHKHESLTQHCELKTKQEIGVRVTKDRTTQWQSRHVGERR